MERSHRRGPRRAALIASALATAIALAACGSSSSSTNSHHAGGAGAKTASDTKVIYIGGDANDPAYEAIACGARKEAKQLHVQFTAQYPAQFTPVSQTPVVNAAAAKKPSALVISPNDAKAMYAPLQQAKAAGIPIVTALNTLSDASPLAAQSLDDENAGGRAAADHIAKLAHGRHVDVAVVTYKPGASVPADTRWHNFTSEIKKYPNIHYVGAQFMSSLDPSDATQLADGLLSRDPHLFAIDGTFGFAGQGVATAVHQRGLHTDVVTYDADAGSINDLKQGLVQAVIDYDQPAVGAFALRQAVNAANGKPVTAEHAHGPIIYTKANINRPSLATTLDGNACES